MNNSSSKSNELSSSSTKKDYDVFRDSPLRYAGYCNEVGESFRYQFPRAVVPSYVVAFGYCFADAATNGWETWQHQQHGLTTRNNITASATSATTGSLWNETARVTCDTLLWQSLASVMIPGATINMIVKASRWTVRRITLPVMAAEWFPTMCGLGSIPFIVSPIDEAVDVLLDQTTRQWWPKESS